MSAAEPTPQPAAPPAPPVSVVVPVAPPAPTTPAERMFTRAIDRLGDLAGVAALVYLAAHGKISGLEAGVGILALLGALEGLRRLGIRVPGAGAAAAGVVALGLGVLHAARAGLGAIALGFLLVGCPAMPAPDGCTPGDQRCAPAGAPEVCSPSQRWTPADRACDRGAVCCRARGVFTGAPVATCVPADRCLPEPAADAGDDADADAAEGGAQ